MPYTESNREPKPGESMFGSQLSPIPKFKMLMFEDVCDGQANTEVDFCKIYRKHQQVAASNTKIVHNFDQIS